MKYVRTRIIPEGTVKVITVETTVADIVLSMNKENKKEIIYYSVDFKSLIEDVHDCLTETLTHNNVITSKS